MRYDEATASLAAAGGAWVSEPWNWYPCGLDAPFVTGGDLVRATCANGSEEEWAPIVGEHNTSYSLLGGTVTGSLTVKRFSTLASGTEMLTDVGLLGSYGGDPGCAICIGLVYARLDGVEYGTPVLTVGAEPEPEPVETALVVAPNPLREAAELRFALDASQRLVLEVYDVRGRRVQSVEVGARGAGAQALRFEAAGLTPGAYLLRLHGDGGFAATRGVIVAR